MARSYVSVSVRDVPVVPETSWSILATVMSRQSEDPGSLTAVPSMPGHRELNSMPEFFTTILMSSGAVGRASVQTLAKVQKISLLQHIILWCNFNTYFWHIFHKLDSPKHLLFCKMPPAAQGSSYLRISLRIQDITTACTGTVPLN